MAISKTKTYYEALNQTLLVQKYRGSFSNPFYSLETYGTHYVVACPEISEMFH